MFRKALESILRVSLHVTSCVCYQPSLTLFIWYRALLYSVSHWALHSNTHTHKPGWEAQREIYCRTNKHIHNRDPEKVQWESRCQFSHAALMGAPRVNISTSFSELLALVLFTASSRHSTVTADQEPLTCMERWEKANYTALTDSSQHKTPVEWALFKQPLSYNYIHNMSLFDRQLTENFDLHEIWIILLVTADNTFWISCSCR